MRSSSPLKVRDLPRSEALARPRLTTLYMPPSPSTSIPRPGMFATVRNRRGVITNVEPFDGDDGRLHLVHLDYKDDQLPHEEQLLWEIESRKNVLEPTTLPRVDATDPMPPQDFDALVRASRW